ncbi:hypothetical protein JCM8547_009205 [Rhodosporidiobolus lusitaniae]
MESGEVNALTSSKGGSAGLALLFSPRLAPFELRLHHEVNLRSQTLLTYPRSLPLVSYAVVAAVSPPHRSSFPETANPNQCRWRFCTEAFPTQDELETHLAQHVQEAPAHHPKEERDADKSFRLQHDPTGLAGATADGERPAPHAEQSFPNIDRKTGEVEAPVHHQQ